MTRMNKILAWHFVREDRRLGYGCGLEVAPGFTYSEDGPIVMCKSGLHASKRVYDALNYAPGAILCRVRMYGDVEEGSDKLAARHREVLEVRDVSSELRLWGCWCIRKTPISGGGGTTWGLLTDERSRKVVKTAEAFARGEATGQQLIAAAQYAAKASAQGAAEAATRFVAWSAGWASAWDAAVKFQAAELERRMLALFGEKA